jgi:hypothetical protein
MANSITYSVVQPWNMQPSEWLWLWTYFLELSWTFWKDTSDGETQGLGTSSRAQYEYASGALYKNEGEKIVSRLHIMSIKSS